VYITFVEINFNFSTAFVIVIADFLNNTSYTVYDYVSDVPLHTVPRSLRSQEISPNVKQTGHETSSVLPSVHFFFTPLSRMSIKPKYLSLAKITTISIRGNRMVRRLEGSRNKKMVGEA
jgi:hypothetical protein